jgi:chemotaxis methyl-accepting protein methylase
LTELDGDAGAQQKIEQLLSKRIGLNPDSLGARAIARAIDQRMGICKLLDKREYWQLLQTSLAEIEALIESVVIPETYFFRNRQSFVFLDRYLKQEWLPQYGHSRKSLRVLSLPCSTGEEPYSIAITLAAAGLNLERVRIDAIDISRKALDKAERAIYEDYSFRRHSVSDYQAYFEPVANGSGYQVCEAIRRCVRFEQGNLFDSFFALDRQPYDLIFCRNLLIYLHANARRKAHQLLERLLVDRGILFLGYAETVQINPHKFSSVHHPLSFAYQKINSNSSPENIAELNPAPMVSDPKRSIDLLQSHTPPRQLQTNRLSPQRQLNATNQTNQTKPANRALTHSSGNSHPSDHLRLNQANAKPRSKPDLARVTPISPQAKQLKRDRLFPAQSQPLTTKPSPTSALSPNLTQLQPPASLVTNSQLNPPIQALLQSARDLANVGQLSAAAELCETYLSQDSTCSHAYLLYGEILQALGQDDRAEECWHKAIYLRPDCYEALVHLALLKEQRGDRAGAMVMRQRIERCQRA